MALVSYVPALTKAVPSAVQWVLWYAIMVVMWYEFVFGKAWEDAYRISQEFPFASRVPIGKETYRRFMVVVVSFMLLLSTVLFVLLVGADWMCGYRLGPGRIGATNCRPATAASPP